MLKNKIKQNNKILVVAYGKSFPHRGQIVSEGIFESAS